MGKAPWFIWMDPDYNHKYKRKIEGDLTTEKEKAIWQRQRLQWWALKKRKESQAKEYRQPKGADKESKQILPSNSSL